MKAKELIIYIEAQLQELAAQTETAKRSEEVLHYLKLMSNFHRYSFHNTLSIYLHCPHASHVAGFHRWRKYGRTVKKGEKGIPILAPCLSKATETDDDDSKQKPPKQVLFFKIVYVFDVTQTDGKPLPEAPITVTGSDMGLLSILESITAAYAIQLQYKTMSTSSPQGVSYGGRIEIDDCLEPAGKTLVLLHELAHELLHKDETRASTTRQQRELEAAVAYVVASHFGLGTASANYLA